MLSRLFGRGRSGSRPARPRPEYHDLTDTRALDRIAKFVAQMLSTDLPFQPITFPTRPLLVPPLAPSLSSVVPRLLLRGQASNGTMEAVAALDRQGRQYLSKLFGTNSRLRRVFAQHALCFLLERTIVDDKINARLSDTPFCYALALYHALLSVQPQQAPEDARVARVTATQLLSSVAEAEYTSADLVVMHLLCNRVLVCIAAGSKYQAYLNSKKKQIEQDLTTLGRGWLRYLQDRVARTRLNNELIRTDAELEDLGALLRGYESVILSYARCSPLTLILCSDYDPIRRLTPEPSPLNALMCLRDATGLQALAIQGMVHTCTSQRHGTLTRYADIGGILKAAFPGEQPATMSNADLARQDRTRAFLVRFYKMFAKACDRSLILSQIKQSAQREQQFGPFVNGFDALRMAYQPGIPSGNYSQFQDDYYHFRKTGGESVMITLYEAVYRDKRQDR